LNDDIELAISIFKFNTEINPNSYNVYDSYAESLLKSGDVAGATENYKKSVLMNPDNTNAISVLDSLGISVDSFLPEVNLTEGLLDSYVGVYQLDEYFSIAVSREGMRLYAKPTGQERVELFPASEVRFYLKVVDAQVTFDKDETGNIVSLILHQNGDHVGRKLQ